MSDDVTGWVLQLVQGDQCLRVGPLAGHRTPYATKNGFPALMPSAPEGLAAVPLPGMVCIGMREDILYHITEDGRPVPLMVRVERVNATEALAIPGEIKRVKEPVPTRPDPGKQQTHG